MRLGISYWGFCQRFEESTVAETPDGVRYGRPILVDAMVHAGHSVIALQERREIVPYPGLAYDGGFPELDALFVEWRWPTYKNLGPVPVEPDLARQTALLNHYTRAGIPVVTWDPDFKITAEDEARWPTMTIADPALRPRHLTRDRVRLLFWTDFKPLFEHPHQRSCSYTYVGNNYERDDSFARYIAGPAQSLRALGIQTSVYGNWLSWSPERKDPSWYIRTHPNVAFCGRLGFYDSMVALNRALCTTHIQKDEYYVASYASGRYIEALMCWTPALVPHEFRDSSILGSSWVVRDARDVVEHVLLLSSASMDARMEIVEEQLFNLRRTANFGVDETVSFFESLA